MKSLRAIGKMAEYAADDILTASLQIFTKGEPLGR